MKKKVYNFVKENPMAMHHQCAAALHEDELRILNIMHELRRDGYLKVAVAPLGNDISSDDSNFYSVRKEYSE